MNQNRSSQISNEYQLSRDRLTVNIFALWIFCFFLTTIHSVSAQVINQSDPNALKLSTTGVGALNGVGSGVNMTRLQGILSPNIGIQDEMDAPREDKKISTPLQLPPNDFQKYVLQNTGQLLPMFGAEFFEKLINNNDQFSRSPVSDDYIIGTGDQLTIRVWGSTSAEAVVTVDRQGAIAFPKLGTLNLLGLKAGQLDAVVKSYFGKFYKDIEVSVSVGKLRKITVFVVGQAKNPGSYSLSGQSTLTSLLFASGGPNASGSLRNLKIMRQGKSLALFDLYSFLGKGDKSQDMKLQDGDVLFYPKAAGYMAVMGKVNVPAIYELKSESESLDLFIELSGGLSVLADPRRVTLDRLQPALDKPRYVESLSLLGATLQTKVKNGDVLNISALMPDIAGAVTLRGSLAQPIRVPWKQGMRVSDLITNKSMLVSAEFIRLNNEVMFDNFEQERTARMRARVPSDLASERVLLMGGSENDVGLKQANSLPQNSLNSSPTSPFSLLGEQRELKKNDQGKLIEFTDREVAIAKLGKPIISEEILADRIGKLDNQINLDYAVIERFNRDTLQLTVLPFNLGKIFQSSKGADDLLLEAGDVITVFSINDIRTPKSRNNAFVKIEGEVNRPGIYPVGPADNLKSMITKAGGTTPEAYLFAIGLFREEVKLSQLGNKEKLLRKMEAETSAAVQQITQSVGSSSEPGVLQSKILSVQNAQKQSLERFKQLKPEGRISLSLNNPELKLENLPNLRLEKGDRIYIPPRPDFIQIFGIVNTESALIYRPGLTVRDYVSLAGAGNSADLSNVILVRADGSAKTNQSFWMNEVTNALVFPGDTIVLPERLDRESSLSQTIRNAKDFTQVMYQLGLGAAAIKTLRQ